jgi:hypothetical protein
MDTRRTKTVNASPHAVPTAYSLEKHAHAVQNTIISMVPALNALLIQFTTTCHQDVILLAELSQGIVPRTRVALAPEGLLKLAVHVLYVLAVLFTTISLGPARNPHPLHAALIRCLVLPLVVSVCLAII